MQTSKKSRLGGLPPQYNFVFNPYPDSRITSCPFCGEKTGQRKLPLLVHVDPKHLIALNYTCRYCRHCDLLVAHKHEIEHLLTEIFTQYTLDSIGNEYLIIGTVDKKVWRKGVKEQVPTTELFPHTHDFLTYYTELRQRQAGWYPNGVTPPIEEPPLSTEWIRK